MAETVVRNYIWQAANYSLHLSTTQYMKMWGQSRPYTVMMSNACGDSSKVNENWAQLGFHWVTCPCKRVLVDPVGQM